METIRIPVTEKQYKFIADAVKTPREFSPKVKARFAKVAARSEALGRFSKHGK